MKRGAEVGKGFKQENVQKAVSTEAKGRDRPASEISTQRKIYPVRNSYDWIDWGRRGGCWDFMPVPTPTS